jgi:hypothetical protein
LANAFRPPTRQKNLHVPLRVSVERVGTFSWRVESNIKNVPNLLHAADFS